MNTEIISSLKMEPENVDALGFGQSERFEIIEDMQIMACLALQVFGVPVYNLETGSQSYPEVTFEEFSVKHPDCDGKFVTCIQLDKDGEPDEKQLAVWDFISEVFHPGSEPYFTEDQRNVYRSEIETTLFNIIESKY